MQAAEQGADAIALSPTHSLFPADPSRYAPYSPSSRLFFNPLLADPATLFGDARVAAAKASEDYGRLEQGKLIDWPAAARAKFAMMTRLFEDFVAHDLEQRPHQPLARDFEAFAEQGGTHLYEHALFEALHRKWFDADPSNWSWTHWPAEWRDPKSDAVREFARAERRLIQFHIFLQWIADRSFASAQGFARESGMRIGLIADLAIGMDPGGSHAWARQKDLLLGLSIGAPPDKFNARGQDWGLTGFSPQALVASGFEAFLATLRGVMRHAGGVRIDHAMGLMRLWVIPPGASPAEGAYLTYPLDDLLNLLVLESHRHGAIVVGEDLGTVPPEFRQRMSETGIAGMDVLWFERDDSRFTPPQRWRSDSVAMTTTHDLPTVAGWWKGADIATRHALGFAPHLRSERSQRKRDRKALWDSLVTAGVAEGKRPAADHPGPVLDAALRFVGGAASPLALIPLEDALGAVEQPNLPGTVEEHPNWRRRLNTSAATLLEAKPVRRRLAGLRERRA
jgi:4-alpha-glucanotransferase